MTIRIIHNPYSARWTSQKRKPEVIEAFNQAGLEFDLTSTEGPGHAIELAEQAVKDGYPTILAAGGDGTLGEVVNGIMRAESDNPLPNFGVLPLGTANDLVFNLGLPADIPGMVGVISKGYTREIDVCKVNDRYFLNNSGIGLEPYVTIQQQKLNRLKGILRYLVATLIAIGHNPTWEMQVEWDSGEYVGPVSLVSVGNGARTGGFFMTPAADPFDGQLTFSFGYVPSRFAKLQALPKAFNQYEDTITEHPRVHQFNTSWLKVMTTPSPSHTDGELFNLEATHLEYEIIPARLPIILNRNESA